MFDLAQVPFSKLGSYLSISILDWGQLGKALYLRTYFGKAPQVFKIQLLRDGQPVDYTVDATPALLTLATDDGGKVECVCDGHESMRLRGQSIALQLALVKERWTNAYPMPHGAWAINLSTHAVQVAVDTLAGEINIDTKWEKGQGFCWETRHWIGMISPDATHQFEVAFDNFLTTWVKPKRELFDAVAADVAAEYEQWTNGLLEVDDEHKDARDLAAYVNWSATVAPAGQLARTTMLMSKMGMCNVYGWDHVFNAMAHVTHQPDLAWDQLMVMSDKQDEFGKCPSSMNRDTLRYTISNAPVQGWALRRMWNEKPDVFTPQRLAEAYDYLARWTNWITTHRTWPGDRLPYYQHGFDGGWDNSSIFDQGVPVIAPDQPAYLILQMQALADIADALDRAADAAAWRTRAQDMLTALIEDLWQDDQFVGIIRPSGQIVKCNSLVTCMPMVIGRQLPDHVRTALFERIKKHQTPHGLATEQPDSPCYQEGHYWRGPIWAPSTMLITTGLIDAGHTELAKPIMKAFCDLCAQHGFYENFSPQTGEGHYDPAYTWTSSVFLIFANQLHTAKLV